MENKWMTPSDDPDINYFKVLMVYVNSPMDNLIPVSISSLSGALLRRGFDVKVFDTTFYPWTTEAGGERQNSLQVAKFDYDEVGIKFKESDVFEDFETLIREYRPDLIAASTVEVTHEFGIQLLAHIRHLNIPVIVGGIFTIFSPDEVIRSPVVDMICVGEGEKCLVELCERMAKGQDYSAIKNLWVKKNGKIYRNEYAPLLNLNELPKLNMSLFEEKRIYRPMAGSMYRMAPIEFSRGCMYSCAFCCSSAITKKFEPVGKWLRDKSITHIIDEMKTYIEQYSIEYFYIVSETFLAMPEKRFQEFCGEYAKIGLPFWFNTRPETITKKKIKMLEEIGCHRMSIGIECGNEEYRRKMLNRKVSNEKIIEACRIVSESSIQLSVNNIIGLPDETRDLIFETIELNRHIDADSYSCNIFNPYRGTALREYCVEKGYIDPKILAKDSTITGPLNQSSISGDEVLGLMRTFPLYVKFPRSEFDLIRRAEKSDEEGDRIFEKLSQIFFEKYV